MYTRILVPLDQSKMGEQVLPYATLLANSLGAKVELLSVIEPPPDLPSESSYRSYMDQVTVNLLVEAEGYLEKVKSSLSGDGTDVSITVVEGDSISVIENEAGGDPSTLITMCSHGRSGQTRWWLGSTTDRLIHTTSNPVLVVRAQEERTLNRQARLTECIAPMDGSAHSEQIIPHVVTMAKALGLKVVLTRIISERDSHFFEIFPEAQEEDREGRASAYLDDVGEMLRLQGVANVETRILHGHPANALADLAVETPDSLVAMTTHGLGKSAIYRWTVGSVTQRVVGSSKNPVLVLPPNL